MSDPAIPTPPADTPSDIIAPTAKKPRTARARTWRIRLTRLLVLVVILGLIFRALIYVVFPPVLRKVAGLYGLNATYDRMELYILGGDIGLWGLKLSPAEGGDPFLTVSYCRGSISTAALLRGRLHVGRAEAEGAQLAFDRTADGRLPLLEKLIAATRSNASAAAPATTQPSGSLSLDPPLAIEALRLQNGSLHFTDHAVLPAADVTLNCDLLVSDIGSLSRRTTFSIGLNSPQTLAALRVEGSGTSRDNVLNADLNVYMFGLNLLPARQYLAPFGIVPTIRDISGRASGSLQARVVGGARADGKTPATQPATLAATLRLNDLSLSADSQPAASVGDVTVAATSLSPGALMLDQITINKVRAAASRTASGRLSFAGVELAPAVATAATTQPVNAAPTTSPTVVTSSVPIINLRRLAVNDCQFVFTDGVFSPAVELKLNVPRLIVDHVSTDPAKANQAATLSLRAIAPGIARTIDANGIATPGAATKGVNLAVTVTGIDGVALDPYLSALGLKRDMRDGVFTCRLTSQFTPHPGGSFTTGLQLNDAALLDGGKSLMAMPLVLLKNTKIDPAASRVSIGELTLVGPTLPLAHDKDNVFAALGVRTDPNAVKPTLATPPPPSPAAVLIDAPATTKPAALTSTQPQAVVSLGLPAVTIDTLSWTGVGISLHDTSADLPIDLGIQDLQLAGKNLVFDAAAKTARPGTIDFSAKLPGVVEEFGLHGTIAPTGESVAFDVKGKADGVSAEKLRPLMKSLGLEPALHAGQLQFGASGDVHQAGPAIFADLKFAGVRLSDGLTNWISLGNASVTKASFDGHLIAIDSIDVDSPTAIARRDEQGGISLAGIRLLPPGSRAPTTQPMAAAKPAPPSTRPLGALPFAARLGALNVHSAKLQWNDAAVAPAADISANIDLSAQKLNFGEDHAPSPFSLTLTSPKLIDSLKVDGQVQATPARQSITLTAAGSGFTGAAINPYLPPNLGMTLKSAAVAAKLSALLEQNPAGGLRAKLAVADASLTDAGAGAPLGAVKSMVVDIDRFDLPGKRIAINELSLEHARLAALQWNGGVSVLGLTLSSTPLRTPKPPIVAPEPVAGEGVSDVAALMAQALGKPPLVTIGRMVLNADSLSVVSSQMGRKVELTNASLWCPGTIEMLGDKPTENPPFEIKAYASIDPLVGQWNAVATLAPLAADPSAKLDLNVIGIHGDKLTAVFPQLASLVNGDDLKNGRLTAAGNAQFKYTRRGPLGIDFSRDIGVTGELKDLSLTEEGVKLPIAGLDAVRMENLRYTPGGSVFIKTLDIDKPTASVVRDAGGIHVLGLTLKIALPPATQPTTTLAEIATAPATTLPATMPANDISPASQPAPTIVALGPTAAPKPVDGPEYCIDKLAVSGVDLRLEDDLGSTHTLIPITDLDVEVKGLTNRALVQENMPIRFSAIVGSGKVQLPVRKQVAGGANTDFRSVFAEASASGNIKLVPRPQGYIKASLSGLELTALRGLASQYGITITGGTFDGRLDVRMTGGESFVAKAFPTLNEARLREAPNGPIQRIFRLPSPVDVVISTVEDADGSITFPITVPVDAGKLDMNTVVSSAVGSVSRVIGDAMVAAPLKAAKLALMAFGVDVSSARTKGIAPVTMNFDSGESQLTAAQQLQLQGVVQQLKNDPTIVVMLQHSLGSGDIVLAEQRVNPLAEDSLQLADQYRQRKFTLQRQLSEQTGAARVAMATQDNAPAALDALRATSIQLKETEDALDQVLDLLRPGADRQAERRTKQAAILLGDLRLRAVQSALLASGLPDVSRRVIKGTARFNADDGSSDGHVTLVLTREAKS